jgi:tetrahydromethanopterin S-methyltransferase subunit G
MLQNSELPENGVEAREMINTIKENQKNQVKDLRINRGRLIDAAAEIELQLVTMSQKLFDFCGVYTKGFWIKILPTIIFLLVATAEMPLNATAFEILGRNQNETLLIAILFGAVIALMAHLSGFFLKRYAVTQKFSNFTVGSLAVVITMAALFVSSDLREQYISTMNSEAVLKTSKTIWFLMSLFIFTAGVISSYHFTTSVKNRKEEKSYYQLLRQFNRVNRQISKIEKSIDNVNKENAKKVEKVMNDMINKEKEKKPEEVLTPVVVENTELKLAKERIIAKTNLRKNEGEETENKN